MSGATTGGITRKVLTGRSAAGLIAYEADVEPGKEPPLFSTSRHCSQGDIPAQVAEFKATRERHGTEGAKRAAKGKYESVDPETGLHASGQMGTHVKYFDGKRSRKRPARDGETPTHFYVEADDLIEKESEAVHTIYAAGADSVNPESIEDCERFFDAVVAERDELYPGIQEKLWLERNGESGLTHVHVASNATIYADFALDGVDYKAGQKMAGALTRVHDVRERSDRFLDEHPELGFSQNLARVGTQGYIDAQVRSGQKDYWEQKRGKESNQDKIRRKAFEALAEPGVVDRDSFVAEMKIRGVEVTGTGLRRGVPGKNYDVAYRLPGMKQVVKGKTLGVEYGHAAIGEQLDRKAQGLEVEPPADRQSTGSAKPLPFEAKPWSEQDQSEYEQMVVDVERMAQAERDRRASGQSQPVQPPTKPTPALPAFDEDELRRIMVIDAEKLRQGDRTLDLDEMARLADGDMDKLEAAAELWMSEDRPKTFGEELERLEREQAEAATAHATSDAQTSPAAPAVGELTTSSASAAGPAIEEPKHGNESTHRSRLHDASSKSDPMRRRLAGLASLEDDYRDRGFRPDPDFVKRIKESGGIGRTTLDKIESRLEPGMHEQLSLYVDKTELKDESYREELRLGKEIEEDREKNPFEIVGQRNKRDDLGIERGFHRDRHKRLTEELDAGVLEKDTPGARAERTVLQRKLAAAREETREVDQQSKARQQSQGLDGLGQ